MSDSIDKIKIFDDVFSYQKKVLERVGKAKGGFTDEAGKLGNRVQKWVKRHSDEGDAKRSGRKMKVVWHFQNKTKHSASGNVMGERGIRRALKYQDKNLRRSLEGKLRRMGKAGAK